MASLLDEVLGQSGWDTTPLLQPPDERPPSLQPDPRVDALGQTYKDITDYMAQQHQKGVDEGYWTGGGLLEGGHPTLKAFNSAADEYAQGLLMGTTSSSGKYLKAYHGSPHLFPPTAKNPLGEFDPAKIGTGEGAQAYGVGAGYLAEREGVAREYRDALTPQTIPNPEFHALHTEHNTADVAARDAIMSGTEAQYQAAVAARDAAKAKLAAVQAFIPNPAGPRGHMYEVNVHADPEKFLYWDKPLSEQHPDVQKFFRDQGFSDLRMRNPGSTAYGALSLDKNMKMTKAADVSAAMREAGIPGIRYLDAGSRQNPAQIAQSKQAIVEKQNQIAEIQADIARNQNNPGLLPRYFAARQEEIAQHQQVIDQINGQMKEGTHNLVVFDPATMEIIRRYGLAGLMLGGGGLLSPDKQEQ